MEEIARMNIDWNSSASEVFLNPRMPSTQKKFLLSLLQTSSQFTSHVWLATSGSTKDSEEMIKLVGLSKNALLTSAQSVNQHLDSQSKDIWANPLPIFHVGGLSIWARSFLSHSKCYAFEEKWNPELFVQFVSSVKATLTSLVPTQVYDLVLQKMKAPENLRAIIVGGGAISKELCNQAKNLGWKLLPSYGLTECSSQVATATEDSFNLKILSHIELKINEDGLICIKSKSLLSTYLVGMQDSIQYHDPKVDGWLTTKDLGEISGCNLKILGRAGDFVKIGGESVELLRLEKIFDEVKLELGISFDAAILAMPDSRLGHTINLAIANASLQECQPLIDRFHERVLPFEKIRQTHQLAAIPRSPLGKVLKNQLLLLILVDGVTNVSSNYS